MSIRINLIDNKFFREADPQVINLYLGPSLPAWHKGNLESWLHRVKPMVKAHANKSAVIRPVHAYLDPGRTEYGRWHSAVTMTAGPGSCGDSRHEGWAPSALTRSASEHSCTSPAAENVVECCQQCNIWNRLDTRLQATGINHEVYIIVVTQYLLARDW